MEFTFVSWNILAPIHVRPERYPRVSAEVLDGATRLQRILDRLLALDPDVIALQEVEPEWVEAIHEALRHREYDWRLTLKQIYKLEGVALFTRRSRFGPARFEEVFYQERGPGVEPTGNVALLAHVTCEGRPLILGTTHLKWELPEVPAERHRGVLQSTQLIEHLSRLHAEVPTVLSGDFNATSDSAVLAPLWAAGYRDPFALANQPTGAFNNQATRIDFLVHTPQLTATVDRLPSLSDASILPSVAEPSDHLLLRGRFSWV